MSDLVDVGRWMGVIRRRARLVVVAEELRALESELAGSEVDCRVLDRVRGLRELVKDL
jgi:hypothetical protein